jgi:hypothetical protein
VCMTHDSPASKTRRETCGMKNTLPKCVRFEIDAVEPPA